MGYKVLVLGDYGTGKTTLFNQFLNVAPKAEKKPSIKLELIEFPRIFEGKEYIISLYDIPGRELTSNKRSKLYTNTVGALILFDISRPDTFRHALFWIEELINYSGIGKVPIILVGNKSDLREISQKTLASIDAKEFIFRLNRTSLKDSIDNHFFEVSAKSGKLIVAMIDQLLVSILKHEKVRNK